MSSRSSRSSKKHLTSSGSGSESSSYTPPSLQYVGNTYASSDSDASTASYQSGYRHSMDSSQRPMVSVEVLRCMRCARTVEVTTTDDAYASGMIRVGTNIYYCGRCAKMVGYT